MKASELMKGDIAMLSIDLLKESCQPFVSQLNIKSIAAIDNGQLVAYPIPLTEEILKAIGFVFDDDRYGCFEHNGYQIEFHYGAILRICDPEGRLVLQLSKKNWTVHELQQALRLCGLNDLANNFKISIYDRE